VDISPEVITRASQAGLTGVAGDATRGAVLDTARIGQASCLVVAVGRDDTAVLVTLTARQLNPQMMVVAAVKEAENEPLLRQSGADQVVVSAETAGRMLAMSTIEPAAGAVLTRLAGRNLGLIEWPAEPAEIGQPAVASRAGTIAVVRGDSVLALDDPRAGQIEPGDRLVRVSAAGSGQAGGWRAIRPMQADGLPLPPARRASRSPRRRSGWRVPPRA
jgi:voltage-gated potassium channel